MKIPALIRYLLCVMLLMLLTGCGKSSSAQDRPEKFIFVEGGSFDMGSNNPEANDDEHPVHPVTVSSFYIADYEVTQYEWDEVMNPNPSYFKGSALPVECVSWYAAVEYCNKRSQNENLTSCYVIDKDTPDPNNTNAQDMLKWTVSVNWDANGYRLPTEAEWEYAAKGGKQSKKLKYSGSDDINKVGWYELNSGDKTHVPGKKAPNQLGLYDMTGNVWEWCWDWYDSDYYISSPGSDPRGAESGEFRSVRGGAWYRGRFACRIAFRDFFINPGFRFPDYGFCGLRLVRAKM